MHKALRRITTIVVLRALRMPVIGTGSHWQFAQILVTFSLGSQPFKISMASKATKNIICILLRILTW